MKRIEAMVFAGVLAAVIVLSIFISAEINRMEADALNHLFYDLRASTGVHFIYESTVDMPISIPIPSQRDLEVIIRSLNLSTIYYTHSVLTSTVYFYAVELEGRCMHSASVSYCWTATFNLWEGRYK